MAPLHLISALIAFLAAAGVAAAEPAREPVEIRFVPAGVRGTVSLGIHDVSGKLVRVLCDEWTFNRFRIGLNGLSTTWDGLDDSGQPVPAGTYKARGFIVGDISMAGTAFHFNDWIETENSPRIVRVAGQQILPGGDILLAARLAGGTGALVRYSPDSEARWRTVVSEPRSTPVSATQLAVSDTLAFGLLDGALRAAHLETGEEVTVPVALEGVRAVAARGDRLAIATTGGLRFFRLPDFSPGGGPSDAPANLTSLALTESGVLACTEDGMVWRFDGAWTKQDLPDRVLGVAAGRADTFWVLEQQADGAHAVAQYSPREGRLAEWIPGEGTPSGLTAAAGKDYFAVTLAGPGEQRTVAIRRNAEGTGWEFVLDKRIVQSADFGWLDGAIRPSGGDLPGSITVRIGENPLDSSAPRSLDLKAVAGGAGSALSTVDGLPLVRVSDAPGFSRVMVIGGDAPGTARFFQGDGACVEEFELGNLGDITAFDAGEIVMTTTGEAPPPPVVEPEE